jgi:hypothetical protein
MFLGNLVSPHAAAPPFNFNVSNIYIQPCDEKDEKRNAENLAAAIEICEKVRLYFMPSIAQNYWKGMTT